MALKSSRPIAKVRKTLSIEGVSLPATLISVEKGKTVF